MPSTKELIYSETDGSCAYCGIKDYRVLTIHHIIQQEPKDESYDNKILLCNNCHILHHDEKGPSKEDLITIKKRLIMKTLTQQGINALKEAYRKEQFGAAPYMVNHLVELQLIELVEVMSSIHISSDKESILEALFKITDEGKHFVAKWELG